MRIAIDASRTTVARVTGTERYALELLRAIMTANSAHDLTLYFRDAPSDALFRWDERTTLCVIPQPRLWTHTRFAAALWRSWPDLTFVPAHTLPVAFPGRAVVTVHDLGYRWFPEAHPLRQRAYLDLTTGYSAQRASLVFADSQATKADLMRFYDISPEKIEVLYPGVVPPDVRQLDEVRARYGLPERYWLYMGTLQPRKNIRVIVEAYRRWRALHPSEDAALVLAGGHGWLYDPAWTQDVPGIIETGYVDEADKGALYTGALALLFPSLYEGFGFPVAEALHCGTPVICSRSSSLPEVGGGAVSYVPLPPSLLDRGADADQRRAALHAMAEDLAAVMSGLGPDAYADAARASRRQQAAKFTWQGAAQQALAAFERV